MSIFIIKNDGRKEPYTPEKIHQHLAKACSGLDVDVVSIIKDARLKIFDSAKSSDIQSALIKSAQEKIDPKNPDYELAAGRLLNQKLRKEVYGQFEPKSFREQVKMRIEAGWYTEDLLLYSDDELDYLGSLLDYSLDDQLPYSALNRLYNSYLIKSSGKPIETPQEAFILIPMAIFAHRKDDRIQMVELGYNLLKDRKISLPTPIMNGARSPFKRFVSCNLIDAGDSVDALGKATAAIMSCTASKSGLGINASFIRGLGASIGKPERVKHTGILPLIKTFEAATASLTQVGRQGSCNISMPFWHYEIELFTQLGDSRGSLENRARHTDQTIIINRWFLEKALAKEDIYLFHVNEVTSEDLNADLYDAMGYKDRFDALYQHYAKVVPDNHKKLINAWDLMRLILTERMITGRVYLTLADNACRGSFNENLYFTNLCTEIFLPAASLDGFRGRTPEVGCCILGNVNMGFCPLDEIGDAAKFLVNFLDDMIDVSEWGDPAVEYAAKNRRSLGIGISNLFGFLAKEHLFYNTKDARNAVSKFVESLSWHLLNASLNLAKVKGPCNLFHETKFSYGWVASKGPNFDWDTLQEDIKLYGLRNSALMAVPPATSSSTVSNSTAGIEPPRELVTVKVDRNSTLKQLVPFFKDSKDWYTTAWSPEFNNIDYLKLVAEVQRYVDQGISLNLYYNVLNKKQIKIEEILEELIFSFNAGIKTWYYANFRTSDDADGVDSADGSKCASGACEV